MDVLLVGINGRYSHTNLALRYLRNEIRAEGHRARIFELTISDRRQDILEKIAIDEPQVVLLSVYVWNATLVAALIPDLRSLLPKAALILGGPEVSYSAEEWLRKHPEIDCIICGGGEAAVRRLAQQGFVTGAERVLRIPNPPFTQIPFPYLDEDVRGFDFRYIYYESSRGCPCACAYCVSGRADQQPEFRPLDLTLRELDRIIAMEQHLAGPPIVKLVDRTFNADPERARGIWRHLAEAETQARFHFEVHPAFLSGADLEVLAGVPPERFQFEIGVQSVHARTLRDIRRAGSWQSARPMVERLITLGTVAVHLDLIVGLPHDGPEELAASVEDLLALKPHRFEIGFLKSLPGTAIRATAGRNDQVAMHEPPYQVLSNRWLSLGDIARFRRIEQLVDAVWNANHLEAELDGFACICGGYFAALEALSTHAERTGYNLTTRKRHKVEAFLRECAAHM